MNYNKVSRMLLVIVTVFLVLFVVAGVYFIHAGNMGVGIAAFGAAIFGFGLLIFSQTLVMTDTQTLMEALTDDGGDEGKPASSGKKKAPKRSGRNLTAYDIEFDTTFKAKVIMNTDGDQDANNEADVYVSEDCLYIDGLEKYLVEFPYNKMLSFHIAKIKNKAGEITGKSRLTVNCDALYADQSIKTVTTIDAPTLRINAAKQRLLSNNVTQE